MVDLNFLLRNLPSVDQVMKRRDLADFVITLGWERVKKMVNEELDKVRSSAIRDGCIANAEEIGERIIKKLEYANRYKLRRVINATGVIIHTNLGRSPLPKSVSERIADISEGYCNLEYDLDQGERGHRDILIEEMLCSITGAESAMMVNNNAGAVMLVLMSIAQGKDVIVSRGELVEIGGSFRIPDIMALSGANLVEVGTTNRTHLRDYEKAITPDTSLLLKVHRSNFALIGFTSEVSRVELAYLGKKMGIPVIEDLGGGMLLPLDVPGGRDEPTVRDCIESGVDLVTFSGDKLLGGPQAGCIAGKKSLIDGIRKHQLTRALRPDKISIAAMEGLLRIYSRGRGYAVEEIPTLRMIHESPDDVKSRAESLVALLLSSGENIKAKLVECKAKIGGGSFPALEIPSWGVNVSMDNYSPDSLEASLRAGEPPVIARVGEDGVILDCRTVTTEECDRIVGVIQTIVGDE